MRIGGLASGMNVDEIIEKLMSAERMPLDRMHQDRTKLTWKRDAFRDINLSLKELDDMILDMKMSTTYQSKSVSSSKSDAVSASATTSASNGTYKIAVTQLATSAMNISTKEIGLKLDEEIPSNYTGKFSFETFDPEKEKLVEHSFTINQGDTLKDVLKRISDDDNHVRMFYDEQSQRVVMETTRTGKYNETGKEIVFSENENAFFTNFLHLDMGEEKGGTNAKFTYNDHLELESKTNSYTLNGITFDFKQTTLVDEPAILTVSHDADQAFDKIKEFVEKYNELVEQLNGTQREERHRNFPPLTDAQKEDMSEKQIELWEEKAKSGLLRGESIITDSLYSMRRSWYGKVETDGKFTSLTEVGITTTRSYLDGGKLEINEEKLKEALREDPESVQKLFSNNVEGSSRGLINRLEDSLKDTVKRIEERAGKSYSTLEGYTIGKNMKDLNNRIDAFEKKLVTIEQRYWAQFTAMEKAVQRANQQSAYLMSQFSGQ
ncbi:MAG TPA: flagellar hook-associated protein 2 [Cerasibacillus sp.]|uniref:flagellar hook-associated protein 2 n=1 Tax=Cerasibacillus sp. TaxID=2498711 RepID=UPI002F3E3E71